MGINREEALERLSKLEASFREESSKLRKVIESPEAPKKVTDLTTWEAICGWKGITTALPEFMEVPKYLRRHMVNCYVVATIEDVLNEGWQADYKDKKQEKHYAYFEMTSSGLRFATTTYGYGCAAAGCGARRAFKSDELAAFAGRTFLWAYEKLITEY